MNRAVYKYNMNLGPNLITMPEGAKPLAVHEHHSAIALWVEVDTTKSAVPTEFFVAATGMLLPDDATEYIGTALMSGGNLVWHVYRGKS